DPSSTHSDQRPKSMLSAPESPQLTTQQQPSKQSMKRPGTASSNNSDQQPPQPNPIDLSSDHRTWSELPDQVLPPIHDSSKIMSENNVLYTMQPQWVPSQPLRIPQPQTVLPIQQQYQMQLPGQQSPSSASWVGPSQLYGPFNNQTSSHPPQHPLPQTMVLPSFPSALSPGPQPLVAAHMIQSALPLSGPMGPPTTTPPRPQQSSYVYNNGIGNNCSTDGILFSPPVPPLSSMSSAGTSPLQTRRESVLSVEDGLSGHHHVRRRYKLSSLQVLNTLGTGSFGRVHLVLDVAAKEYRALKVMKKTEVVRLKQVEHTINEKTILEQLRHPFLVNLFGVFQDSQNLYLVLEYVQGGELFTYLRKSGRFPTAVGRFYCAQVVLAFEFLHERNIIYRDLKPENLLIDSKGNIKITDFGFAKYVPDVTWTLCGTPDYLAPEIIQAKGYGKAVDWWALGVLLYEMLAGHPPFYDEDHFKLYEKILAGKLRFPGHFDPDAKDLVRKLLTADLTRRFGNLRGGAADIKAHKFFYGVDWKALVEGRIHPPFIPKSAGPSDTSNFDTYAEDYEPYGVSTGLDPFREKFGTFGPY
ncbi:hypothetical protein SeMB42_g03136, partial [Synchytrium endobioticum]